MRVAVTIEEDVAENDNGIEVPCVIATCSRCGNETMSFGTGEASRKRCLALMREGCPEGETNFYIDGEGSRSPPSSCMI